MDRDDEDDLLRARMDAADWLRFAICLGAAAFFSIVALWAALQ